MEHGFKWLLLHLLFVRALTQSCRALSTAPKQVQLPAMDPAKQFAVDFRMQATSYAAYMMVRDYQTSDASHCNYPGIAADVCKWSAKDPGWERLVRAESMVAIAHQAFQAAEYEEAIIALEESLALRLFAYTDQKTLDRWQQGLVMPGTQYNHDKKAIANSLVLRSDCLVQLALANQDVAELTEATELLQLAAAELQAAQSLTADRIAAISSRMSSIATLAAELLPRLSTRRLHELLEQHGISCSSSNATSAQPPEWCDSPGELLLHLVPLLRLPVCLVGSQGKVLSTSLGCGGSLQQQGGQQMQQQQQQQQQHKLRKGRVPDVEPVSDPFNSFGVALVQKPCEVVAHYLQRMFFRLLSVVPVEYMRDLQVPCQRTDSRSRCISYLPTWVTAQAVTIDKRTGRAHVTGPSSYAVGSSRGSSRSAADAAACAAAPRSSSSCQASSTCSTCSCSRQSNSCSSSSTHTEQQGSVDVCGFLHIKALAPGMQLPLADAKPMSAQQLEASQRAADAAAVQQGTPVGSSCSASSSGSSSGSSGGCKASSGVYYYYFPDVPAVLDHVIVTQETEDSNYLLTLLDDLTQPYNLRQWVWMAHKGTECTEAALSEGRAPPDCSVLIPSIGDCSGAKPQAGTPLSQLPANFMPQARMRTSAVAAAAAVAPSPGGAVCGAAPVSASRSRCSSSSSSEADGGEGGVSKRGRRQKTDSQSDDDDDGDIITSSSGSSRRNSNGSKRRRSKQSSDPYLDAPPYPHMYNSFARVDREIADRQLLEQMNKLQRDKQHKQQDGPLIPLTLGMLVLMCCLPFIASRFRRVSSRQLQQQQQQQGVLGWLRGRKGVSVSVAAAAAGTNSSAFSLQAGYAGGNISSSAAVGGPVSLPAAASGVAAAADGSSGSSAPDSSHLQRLAAAAVKAALSSNDLDSMEGAVRQAEGAGMGNTANCVRLRELLAKRKRQAQQAKRQEQMRQQELARRGRRRKGYQEPQGVAAAESGAGSVQQQAASSVQQQGKKGEGKKAPSAFSAWLKRVFLPASAKQQQKAATGGASSGSKGLGRVSDSSSTAAAAAADGISRSCSISSSRSASSSMISSSASVGAVQLQLLAETTSNSSRGCSPATSVSCSPQSSIGLGGGHQQASPESHSGDTSTQQQQQRSAGRRSGRGSVTVAVAARGSSRHQQQQQGLDSDVAELAQDLIAVRDARVSSSSNSRSSSPQAVSAANRLAVAAAASPARARAKQQQQQKGGCEAAYSDATSPVGNSAAGSLPIYTPPKSSGSTTGGKAATGTAAAGKKAKGKQQRQAVSVSAAAHGSDFGHNPPTAVITASGDGSGSTRSSSGTLLAAVGAAGVEPPATPAGAVSASPLRSDRHQQQQQQQLPPPWQQQQQQQQQRHTVRTGMSWLEAALPSKQRAAAVSDDGTMSNSSSCLNSPAGAQQQQQQAAAASTNSTPTKAKLNPKAAPYNPKGYAASPVPPGAAAAAANASPGGGWLSPAPNAAGLILTPSPQGAAAAAGGSSGSNSWQQQQHSMLAARAVGSGGNLAAAAAAAGVASMLPHQEGGSVSRRLSCNGLLEPSAVGGMGGLPPPGNLMGGMSAAAAAAAAGLQGGQTLQQMLLQQQQQHYGLLSPHPAASMQQQQAAAAAAWQQQQQQLQDLQREEQLMAMLSALSPEEASAAATATGLQGAGGSAPQPLGTAGSSGITSAGGGLRVDSSSSSSGDFRGHFLGAVASHGLNWMTNAAVGPDGPGLNLGRPPLGSRSTPPGLSGALSCQQQQQQFQKPGRISLPQDLDFQLPPGFSAETFTSHGTPGSATGGPYSNSSSVGGGAPGVGAFSPAAAPTPGSLASPASGVGMPASSAAMLAGGSNPWSYVPAQGKPATPLLIVSEAATAGPLGMQGYVGHGGQAMSMSMDMSHAMNMDMDHSMVAAAAATSMNVAELVLGSSPPPVAQTVAQTLHGVEELFYRVTGSNGGGCGSNSGGCGSNGGSEMTAADADAHAARLADEMTAGVLLD